MITRSTPAPITQYGAETSAAPSALDRLELRNGEGWCIALSRGRYGDKPEQTARAARKGLTATGACEECYRNLMRAAIAEGNQTALDALTRADELVQ